MFAVIFIPDFSLQAVLRHEPQLWSRPVGIIDDSETKAPIFQMTSIARNAGVVEGLTSTQALARCGDIVIKMRSRMQEQTATEALLQTAYAFSPRIESTSEGVCTMDLQGLPAISKCMEDLHSRRSEYYSIALGTCDSGSLSPRGTSGERVGERGNDKNLLSPTLSSLLRREEREKTHRLGNNVDVAQSTGSRSEGELAPRSTLQDWAQKILTSLTQVNLRGQIGVAATPDLALQAAHFATSFLFVEDATEFISALPIASIEPTPPIADILDRWGIRTVGAFTALGKDKIVERLGPEALELFDRASAETLRPLNLVTPSETFSEAMDFEIEIESLQPLLFIFNRFIGQLSARLIVSGFVAQELQLRLRLSSGEKYEHTFTVPSPTANTTVLLRMLETHMESVRTESSIVALELSVKPTRSENHQFGLFETSLRDPNHFSETLARLSALCGNENVGSPMLQETYRPDAFKIEKPRFDSASSLDTGKSSLAISYGLSLRRFRPAFHADVELKNGEPVFISSLKLNSPIQKLAGPFRSCGDWWEQEKTWNRDEWDIQTRDGALYRIYCERDDWFVEGIYD